MLGQCHGEYSTSRKQSGPPTHVAEEIVGYDICNLCAEMLSNVESDAGANSTVAYFYSFHVHLKLFQNKMFQRGSYSIGCFVLSH